MNINLDNLQYFYGKTQALKNLSFSLDIDNKCIALVGHNGAGKSTLINVICKILTDYNGKMEHSNDISIAYLPFNNPIYDSFTVYENLLFWFQLYNNEKFDLENETVKQLISDFNLTNLLSQKVQLLSSGEKRKTALACILLGSANFIVLDEPFNGLDIASVTELCNLIKEYKSNGKSFLISSHQLDVLNKISDQTLILKEGELVFNSSSNDDSIIDTYVKIYE